jgi:Co/Zn/Cd efflux system component
MMMTLFGCGVLVQAALRFRAGEPPTAGLMGAIGGLALVANFACAAILLRHRNDDLNMRSTWLCSRNDVIANLGVLGAAAAVAATGSLWPDLVVGAGIAALVLRSALHVLGESAKQLRGASRA